MPVVASAIASPIHSPAIETVVSFCTGESGIVVMAAFRLTAIDAVRMVVPIRSSIGLLLFMCIYTYRGQTMSRPAAGVRSAEIASGEGFQRGLAVRAEQIGDMGLCLRPVGKAAPHDAPPLRGNADHAGAGIVARRIQPDLDHAERPQHARQRRALPMGE